MAVGTPIHVAGQGCPLSKSKREGDSGNRCPYDAEFFNSKVTVELLQSHVCFPVRDSLRTVLHLHSIENILYRAITAKIDVW